MRTLKTILTVILCTFALEICPFHTPSPSPTLRSRIERTCGQRWIERTERRMLDGFQRSETVILASSGPIAETPVPVRVKRRLEHHAQSTEASD